MEAEKKLQTMEEEMKLLKGELKQSLASVRDYLLNMELPSSEFSTILAALGNDGGGAQKMSLEGRLSNDSKKGGEEPEVEEVIEEEVPEDEDDLALDDDDILNPDTIPEDELDEDSDADADSDPESELFRPEETSEDGISNTIEDPGDMEDGSMYSEPDLKETGSPLEEESLMGYDRNTADLQPSTPRVNLLANLITWVAKAKREIGHEQLSAFLEVYGVSGHLSPELKEAILQLAEITAAQSEEANKADVWSQSMLSLHGILTGGDAPLYPFKTPMHNIVDEEPVAEEEIIEVDKPKNSPIKLKLILPNDDGNSKEFCVDLMPDIGNGNG